MKDMKQIAIRCAGALLAVLGVMKLYPILGWFGTFPPIARELAQEGTPVPGVEWAYVLNGLIGIIAVGKIVGGLGLVWIKPWAKWTAAGAAALHVLFLTYFGILIWIQMANGTFENPAGIPIWKDFVTIAVNLAILVTILTCTRKAKETGGTTTNCTLSAGTAEA